MQVQVAETGPCSRTVTIKVPPARIQEQVDEIYAAAAQQARIPGFRPGKVPRKMLEKKFGPGILAEAKERIVNRCVQDALRDQKLSAVGRITVDGYEQLELHLDQPLELTFKVDVRPEVVLGDVRGIEVESFAAAATEQDVEAALAQIAGQKRAIKPVQEPAQDGDFLKVDLRFLDESGAVAHERKGVQINTRISVAGTDPQAFQQVLTGAVAGQQLELPLTFPDTFEKEALRGKAGLVAIQVHGVLRVTAPPIDDALAKGLDFGSLDELRADLRRRIAEEKEQAGRNRQEEQALETLLNQHPFDVPASLVADQTEASLRQYEQRLKESGLADDEVQRRLEGAREEAHKDAERRVRLFFLIDAIARKEKLFVTESDVDAEIRKIAQHHNVTPGQAAEALEANRQMGDLRLGLMERKVREHLRENAKTVDRKGA